MARWHVACTAQEVRSKGIMEVSGYLRRAARFRIKRLMMYSRLLVVGKSMKSTSQVDSRKSHDVFDAALLQSTYILLDGKSSRQPTCPEVSCM